MTPFLPMWAGGLSFDFQHCTFFGTGIQMGYLEIRQPSCNQEAVYVRTEIPVLGMSQQTERRELGPLWQNRITTMGLHSLLTDVLIFLSEATNCISHQYACLPVSSWSLLTPDCQYLRTSQSPRLGCEGAGDSTASIISVFDTE